MPRKKTEELAVMPEAPALPVVPEEAAEQPVTEDCLPETAANPVVEDTVPTESVLAEPAEVVTVPEDPQPSEKPKRTVRKRTAAKKTVEVEKQATPPTEDAAASAEPASAAVQQRYFDFGCPGRSGNAGADGGHYLARDPQCLPHPAHALRYAERH